MGFARRIAQRLKTRTVEAPASRPPAHLLDLAAEADARGDHHAAERLCRDAIAALPDYAPAWMNLGLTLQLQGRAAEALPALQRAVELDPASAPAHYNLGRLYHARGRAADAVAALARAVEAAPAFVDARIALADAHEAGGDRDAAARCLRAALEVDPAHAGALQNYSLLLNRGGDADEVLRAFRHALERAPQSLDAALGAVLAQSEIGEVEEGLELARRTLEAHPSSERARVVYLFALLLGDRVDAAHVAAEHKRVGALYEAEAPSRTHPHANARDPAKRLRVGYLSGDLNAHSCSLLLEPVLEHHERAAIAPIAYSCSTTVDAYTERMRPRFDLWRDAANLDDAALAALIEADGVDLLVDLAGYTSASRVGVIARRPAPVQASWVAYISTSGLESMTHRLTDAVLDPPGTEEYNTETLQRLPRSLWTYRPPREAVVDVAGDEGQGPVRFGSFNRYAKVSATTMKLWCAVLHAVPQSTLTVLTVPRGQAQRTLLARFEAAGIDRSRIRLLPRLDQSQYYAAHREVDVCFDTTPYSGGFTTCDALWMGVPVVTLRGATSVSRSAASILACAGFGSWIADDHDAYVRIAVELARAGRAGARSRESLRERFRGSPVMDEAGYTRDLESAYREMWTQWCRA